MIRKTPTTLALLGLLLYPVYFAMYCYWRDDIADKIEPLFGAGNISVVLKALVVFLPIVLLIPAIRASVEYSRRERRKAFEQCLNCGYDLRGSKDRCPECGESFE